MVSAEQRGTFKSPGCGFCRKNCEPVEVYRSHRIKDQQGNITCPQLFKYTCDLCGATGLQAHTRSYCPQLSANRDFQRQQQQQSATRQDDMTRTFTSAQSQQQPKLQYEAELERELDRLIPRQSEPLQRLQLQQEQHQFNQVRWRQPGQLDYNLNKDQLFNINNNHCGYINAHNGLVSHRQNGIWPSASYEGPPLIPQQALFSPTTTIGHQQHQAFVQPTTRAAAATELDANFEPLSLHLSQAGIRNMGRVTNSRYNSAGKLRKTANGGRSNHQKHNYNGRNHQ